MTDTRPSSDRDALRQHEETFYRLIRPLLTDVAVAKLGVMSSRANDLLHKLKHLERLRTPALPNGQASAQALEYARRLNDIAINCEVAAFEGDASDLRRIAGWLATSPTPQIAGQTNPPASADQTQDRVSEQGCGGSVQPPDRGAPSDPAGDVQRAGGVREALKRLHLAVRSLGKIGDNKITLFEDSPLKNQECFEAWEELNAAQGDASKALGFKLLFDGEWLKYKIASDPDLETEAGRALSPQAQAGETLPKPTSE